MPNATDVLVTRLCGHGPAKRAFRDHYDLPSLVSLWRSYVAREDKFNRYAEMTSHGPSHMAGVATLVASLSPQNGFLTDSEVFVLLAGANRREAAQGRDDVDDGILTGMEVAGLDLWGTRLVVLSACETGLGDVQQGEGVMGLRRAFFLAGARRVLSTLWKVPDLETQQLMTDFITRWKAGTPGVDALRDAQIAMIGQMRKQHGHAHPFYWAAFTMTGDWR
jgi:CHAT domain-containing protein